MTFLSKNSIQIRYISQSWFLMLYKLKCLLDARDNDQTLSWNARLKVAYGSARGLAYLHHDCSPRIIHRDIKSSNILLDDNLEPCVSDFGLAKLLVDEEAHVTTVVAGTFGYLAPGLSISSHINNHRIICLMGLLFVM